MSTYYTTHRENFQEVTKASKVVRNSNLPPSRTTHFSDRQALYLQGLTIL